MKNKGFFDIEIEDDELVKVSSIQEVLGLKDLQNRKITLNEDIEQYTIADIVKNIMQYNADDKGIDIEARKPILLYIASNGGDVCAGFELIDAIQSSKTPVYTINLGNCYSMGFLISLAGHKRFASRNAKYLMHDGSSVIWNSGTKAQDQMEFNKRVEERIKQYILERSSLTEEEYDSKLRVEWYLFADEAKEKGFVDYIVGLDCDIDEII